MSTEQQPAGGTTVLDPDVDVVLDVDLDKDVPCCQDDCPTAATWLALFRHIDDDSSLCGSHPYCTPHRVRAQLVMLHHSALGHFTGCRAHERLVDITWRAL